MMAILKRYVALCGGLGNQMFQYAYYMLLKQKTNDVCMFIPSSKWEHEGGFELHRVFGIAHSRTKWETLYQLGFPFTKLFHVIHKTYSGHNFKFDEKDLMPGKSYRYFYGTWQSEKYILDADIIRNAFKFNESKLSPETAKIAKSLRGGVITCSIHIRRGDYLSSAFIGGFGSCCPLEYYQQSIEYIRKNICNNVTFILFSDDIKWVKENLKLENAIYVNHNQGTDSWQDMYLMSLCNHNIIANSTFSWWGAWLNKHKDKTVIAPKRWWSTIENDDVVPKSWIRI